MMNLIDLIALCIPIVFFILCGLWLRKEEIEWQISFEGLRNPIVIVVFLLFGIALIPFVSVANVPMYIAIIAFIMIVIATLIDWSPMHQSKVMNK